MSSELWLPPGHREPKPIKESGTFVFFENKEGNIVIPPVIDGPTPRGYQRTEIRSAKDIEAVSKRYAAQKNRMFEVMDDRACARIEAKMAEVRGNLNVTLARTKSQFEKDFIREMLKRLEADEARVKTRKQEMHLHMEAHEAPVGAGGNK